MNTNREYLAQTAAATQENLDEGLRAHMLRVYNYMAAAIALTGLAAWMTYSMAIGTTAEGQMGLTAFGQAIYASPLKWVVILAPLAIVFYFSFRIHKMSFSTAQAVFWVYAALMGMSLSSILMVYTGESIARTFFITAASFAGLSLFGYTTKKDLSGIGQFLIMGVIGLIIASVVNLFLESSGLAFAISVIGVLVFAGLTAYDTQKIKEEYVENMDHETSGKLALMGSLRLYLDFILMFQYLLMLLGNRE
ncbi:MAG: Bax inhibitor-1/YccA family protein [Alphaproteobacteria bacterium]|nr:Bax inhibitor-1/YccA family protein [Alphaproteobacteria bacterium]